MWTRSRAPLTKSARTSIFFGATQSWFFNTYWLKHFPLWSHTVPNPRLLHYWSFQQFYWLSSRFQIQGLEQIMSIWPYKRNVTLLSHSYINVKILLSERHIFVIVLLWEFDEKPSATILPRPTGNFRNKRKVLKESPNFPAEISDWLPFAILRHHIFPSLFRFFQ